jgi:hypothetical protein
MKIDQSFVIGMVHDADDFVIVEGVVSLAKAFGRNVLAEGVETIEHGELLLALGCELGQGFGIARPMPAAAVPDWLSNWQPDRRWAAWSETSHQQNRTEQTLVIIKHRHWLRDIENYITAKADEAPSMLSDTCQLSVWLNGPGRDRHRGTATFNDVVQAHNDLHTCAQQAISAFEAGVIDKMPESILTLRSMEDALASAVRGLD